jgi:hypothetical protein
VHSQPYSFFHERSFRERLADGLLPEYLQLAVVASSIRFSSNPYFQGNHSEAITRYASESWKQIVSLWFGPESDPDLNICRAITLLSVIDFTGNAQALLIFARVLLMSEFSREKTSRMAQDWAVNPHCPRPKIDDGA